MGDPIKTVTLASGEKRYQFVVDIGRGPDGKRKQLTRRFEKKGEARAEYDEIRHKTREGTFIRPSKLTVSEYLDSWMEGATRELRASSKRNYRDALRPVRDRFGHRPIQSITKADVEGLVTWMGTAGRRRGGKPGTGLGARSVKLTLGRLTAAFDMAVLEGVIGRNVAKLVKPPKYEPRERVSWTKVEVRKFLTAAGTNRLHAAWRLTLYGLRRGEVVGLRWCDVDLPKGTVQVVQARVLVNGKVVIEPPKSRNGFRTLPLDEALLAALKALKAAQAAERLAAGEAYSDSGYVVVNELGEAVHPEWYSDEFGRVASRAGVRRIVLHEGRHTAGSLMEKAGVPISIISKWLGHYDGGFTMRTYVHADDEDLRTGTEALGKLYKIN